MNNSGVLMKRSLRFSWIFAAILPAFVVLTSFSDHLEAKDKPLYASLVVDANTGKILYARNKDSLRHPASLTKMMTLYMLFGELEKGRLSYDSALIVSSNAAAQAPSKLDLKQGDRITVINAIRALVTKSANDAAVTIAENLAGTEDEFAKEMTRKAHEIGMSRTVFKNASGLPDPEQVTTANDMVVLGQRLMEDFPEYYNFFRTKHFVYKSHNYKNHNRLLFDYEGVDGIKTGYTRASGFNLVSSVRRGDKHLIAVVLGGQTAKLRDSHMKALLTRSIPQAVAMKGKPKVKFAATRHSQTSGLKQVALAGVGAGSEIKQQTKQAVSDPQKSASTGNKIETQKIETQKIETLTMKSSAMIGDGQKALISTAGPYHIQVGAYSGKAEAQAKLENVSSQANDILKGHPALTLAVSQEAKQIIRARYADFSEPKARAACQKLKERSIDCIVMRAE